ncbi:TM2 domain-containing protein 3 isoform 2-T2 [Dama dama]|uniref:TM2 domain-containing protein 3 isoform X2 n=1 Tax=Dama dama TaxID=30532 RepID=UPI002A36CC90|nr:TM2 domain-containing protein 3 isoform X2 [Dama dama]
MAAPVVQLRALCRLCCVVLFLSQFYILSGGGSFSEEPSQPLPQAIKDPGPTRTFTAAPRAAESTDIPPYVMKCPSNGLCSRLPADCIDCKTNFSCVYGKPVTFDCTVKPSVTCVKRRTVKQSAVRSCGSQECCSCDLGPAPCSSLGVLRPSQDPDFKSQKSFVLNMTCRFCWQLPEADYECFSSSNCRAVSCPRQRYAANCTVRDHIHCLGNRTFLKMLYCNWTGGYKWSTALALRPVCCCSITLGGFGADRFYLGQWREGLGKLFSFGGLGIWTLIDVLLIGVGYVGPADGSLYI